MLSVHHFVKLTSLSVSLSLSLSQSLSLSFFIYSFFLVLPDYFFFLCVACFMSVCMRKIAIVNVLWTYMSSSPCIIQCAFKKKRRFRSNTDVQLNWMILLLLLLLLPLLLPQLPSPPNEPDMLTTWFWQLLVQSQQFLRKAVRVWQSHSLRLSTKNQVYRAVVVPTLPYGAETWVRYRKEIRLLERFHQRCLHSILGIKWQDQVSNKEALKRASLPSIESILLQMHLRWAGHVTRMEDVHMPKAVFFSELQEGKCDRSARRKHYKDQLKR